MTLNPPESFEWEDPSPAPLFDLKFLNNFGNNLLKLTLLETFIRTVPSMCDELQDALKREDFRTLRETAHKLKPNIEMMGIMVINDAIKNLEFWPNEQIDDSIQKEVILIVNILKLVVDDFKLLVARS